MNARRGARGGSSHAGEEQDLWNNTLDQIKTIKATEDRMKELGTEVAAAELALKAKERPTLKDIDEVAKGWREGMKTNENLLAMLRGEGGIGG